MGNNGMTGIFITSDLLKYNDNKLNMVDKAILSLLSFWSNDEKNDSKGIVKTTYGTIAKTLGLSNKQVYDSIKKLVTLNYIESFKIIKNKKVNATEYLLSDSVKELCKKSVNITKK